MRRLHRCARRAGRRAAPRGTRGGPRPTRPALAKAERFPDMAIVAAWPDEALGTLRFAPSSAIAVLAHDDKFDHPALLAALRTSAGYIGAIGSRTTNEKRVAWLRAQGVSERDIARVHAPIGLDIGGGGGGG